MQTSYESRFSVWTIVRMATAGPQHSFKAPSAIFSHMKYFFLAIFSSVFIAGCGTTIDLTAPQKKPSVNVSVTDNRSSDEKEYFRSGPLSPVQFFGDTDFSPAPLTQFARLLESRLPAGSYDLKVSKFRVVDIFPKRLNAGLSAAVSRTFLTAGYAAYFADQQDEDNITCLIEGDINRRKFQQKISVTYKISTFAGIIKNDPSFKGAANKCLEQLSDSVARSTT
ncbi:hypothetical protein [Paracidovorax oryzae]|uniref:hypothetical protein n=1 Tax=Paracidovorax oryzae TaxID=862720 RepID=UPI0035CF29C3